MVLSRAAGSSAAVEVFVSIGPQKWLVESVGKDLVQVEVLVKKGQNPHSFEPTPRQVAALSQAKIWYTLDMDFEQQLVRKVRAVAPGLQIVDMSRHVEKLVMAAGDHEQEEAEAGHDHGKSAVDPHVWLSPLNLQVMAGAVAEALIRTDPAHAAAYSHNLRVVEQELTELDQRISEQLSPFKGASFFVFHPSFGYFAHRYGLVQEPVEIGGKSPGPRQLSALVARAKTEGVKVIFVQPQFDPKSAEAIAAAIGGEVVPLDALSEDVAANLMTMAEKIAAALKR
jgi:zinc transport system substrate-binding protein